MIRKLIVFAAALGIAAPAFADEMDFVLVNNAGKEIKTLEVAPTGTTNWQKNKIDPELQKVANVKAGGRTTVHFDQAANVCKYDLRATFTDDTNAIWSGINVCDNAFVTIKLAGSTPSFTAN